MCDRVLQSYPDRDDIPIKSTKQSQSIWMSHWTHKSCRKANEAPNQLGHDPREVVSGNKNHSLLSGPEMETGSSKFVTGLEDVNKGKRINFMNDNLTMSSKKLRNEMFEGQSSFVMIKPSRDRESVLYLKNVESSSNCEGVLKSRTGTNSEYDVSLGRTEDHLSSMPAHALPEVEIQKKNSRFRSEDINLVPEQQFKSNSMLERSSRVVSALVQDDFLWSATDTVPYEFEGGRAPIQSFFSRLDHINEPSSTSLVHEKKMNKKAGLLIHDPSTSNNQLEDFFGKSFQMTPNRSKFELLPRQISPRDDGELKKLYHESYALSALPFVHDVETMRIRTTIDSIEEFSRGPPKYSQTAHLFITKKTDVNIPDSAQMFRESAISTVFKESDSLAEGIESTENVNTSAVNEESDSSAETNTMDLDAFCENQLSGVASLQSCKDINEGQKLPASQAGMPSVRQETKDRQINAELPDINQELPVLPVVARSPDDMETSTSRTHSLDAECFLPHAEHSSNSRSRDYPDIPLTWDSSSRWLKRLKATASDSSGYGTKSSKVEEASSCQKFSKSFNKVLGHNKTTSEPKTSKFYGEESVTDQTAELLRSAESHSTDSASKSQGITLSHTWVQRWCRHPSASPKKKPEAVVVSEPESSEAPLDFQKKQLPSIAAMALMGKAMYGFCPCEFRKRGSSVVWNTNGFSNKLS